MITIVALGNPGEKYAKTRHNVGWIVLHEIISTQALPAPYASSKFTAEVSEGVLFGKEVGVLFPTTYMNASGVSVQRYLESQKDTSLLIVVHDEVDLPFGSIKISRGRGAGGHNGVQSIMDTCGTKDFVRIRVGIAQRGFFGAVKRPKGEKLPKFVLAEFKPAELKNMHEVSKAVARALQLIIEEGVEQAMGEVNRE